MTQHGSYQYRALRSDGVVATGVVTTESRQAAAAYLARQGLFPVEIRGAPTGPRRAARLSSGDLALGLRLLADLLTAGLPMNRALAAFAQLAPRRWQPAVPAMREAIRDGHSLAAALEASPIGPSAAILGIIRAGEAGEGLASSVRRAAELAERAAATQAAIRAALAYPLILAGAATLSLALLVGVVLPRFATLLADAGQAVPATTRLVLTVAHVTRVGAVPALGGLALLAMCAWWWLASPRGRSLLHEVLLQAPWLGPIRRQAATARAAASMAALLAAGVPLTAALAHGAEAASDEAIAARLLKAREAILEGEGVARALDWAGALTETAIQLLRAGEETGRLADMMDRVARLEGESLGRTVKGAVQMLEPGLVLAFGAVVALVAAALLQAVYGVRLTR